MDRERESGEKQRSRTENHLRREWSKSVWRRKERKGQRKKKKKNNIEEGDRQDRLRQIENELEAERCYLEQTAERLKKNERKCYKKAK